VGQDVRTVGERLRDVAAADPAAPAVLTADQLLTYGDLTAQVARLAGRHERVAVIGAGARGQFRAEDQFTCARIAGGLADVGYRPSRPTAELVERWRGAPVEVVAGGASADYLRRTRQVDELEFILAHVDDLDATFELNGRGLVMVPADGRPA